ncbi:hypothetical protein T4A_10218 [Trichinella pseudospiralis]|uniref:Uncharacterized protein n=1 Tax=Trichinella pseudospiralis TaxID=6337 RepID=A0A0V1DSM1_TRIPS|nr:hypothetical protein T4A_10218 [Trichinella pseudospiralis]
MDEDDDRSLLAVLLLSPLFSNIAFLGGGTEVASC